MMVIIEMGENIEGKGENAAFQYVLLLPQYFNIPILQGKRNSRLRNDQLHSPVYRPVQENIEA